MLCPCIYFADIGSFDGEEMLDPPHEPSVDPNDDQDMADAEDDHDQDEAGAAERHADPHAPHGAPVRPFARRGQLDTEWSRATNSVD